LTDPHAEHFARMSTNLRKLADTMVSEYGDQLPHEHFGRAFMTVAISLLLDSVGTEGTADFLRRLAIGVEAGEYPGASGQPN
jgi:hypothetical protein